ncbi:MAG TPA: energy transducer TonB [Candidatus Cybelea sp.]|jgi:tetratricopeptide (TPR) repeat protein|nr:energy transducer TonB [Candidatus Cybelea sp.]
MNAQIRIVAPAVAALVALAQAPAIAQYATEYTKPKLIKQGTTTQPIAGSGTVIVQVQVNADGTHKATHVIKTTNSGDNAAAMEIAQNSTYRPAHRGTAPITSFYDFTLKFSGKSVARTPSEGSGMPAGGTLSPAAGQVAALIRQGQYTAAKSKAEAALMSSPSDESLRQMLGIAAFDAGDFTTAASAFDKVGTIGPQFRQIAARSFATAAVKVAQSDAAQSLGYAQKAVALEPDANSRFALGVAQLASGDATAALASLKAAHDSAMTDSKIPVASKINIDSVLLEAQLANHDSAGAQSTEAEIKQLDPNSTAGAAAMATALIKHGNDAAAANNVTAAITDYDQAAAAGDAKLAVTANTLAAFAIARTEKPDYKRMQAYAEKALAVSPNDAMANFAEGVALTAQWGSSHDAATKQKASDALNKAEAQAKADGNESLSLQIETFMKKNLDVTP